MLRGASTLLLYCGITLCRSDFAGTIEPRGVSLLALKVTPARTTVGWFEAFDAAEAPNSTANHSNATSYYSGRLAEAENGTLCLECATAEEALLAAFRAALQGHTLAEERAADLAEAMKNHCFADAQFASHREAYTVMRNSLEQIPVPPHTASVTEFTDFIGQAQALHAKSQTVVEAEAYVTANRTVMDSAQEAYDEAATTARLGDKEVSRKEKAKDVACASLGLPAPAPPSPVNHTLSDSEMGSAQCSGKMKFTVSATSWMATGIGAGYCDVTLAESFDRVIEASYDIVCLGEHDRVKEPDDSKHMAKWLATVHNDGYFSFGTPETVLDRGGAMGLDLDCDNNKKVFVVGDVEPGKVLRFGFYQNADSDLFTIRNLKVKVRNIL